MSTNINETSQDSEDETMVLRTVFLPKAMDIQLREEASSIGVSKGEYIRSLLKDKLEVRLHEPHAA